MRVLILTFWDRSIDPELAEKKYQQKGLVECSELDKM